MFKHINQRQELSWKRWQRASVVNSIESFQTCLNEIVAEQFKTLKCFDTVASNQNL